MEHARLSQQRRVIGLNLEPQNSVHLQCGESRSVFTMEKVNNILSRSVSHVNVVGYVYLEVLKKVFTVDMWYTHKYEGKIYS